MSIQILLVRHAIAEGRDPVRWPDDRKRPLSAHGRKKFVAAADGLARWIPKVDLVLSSPLTRARQTAKILEDTTGWPVAQVCVALAPYRSPTGVIALLAQLQRERRVALVGHEPGLGKLLVACLGGTGSRPVAEFKKGGVALIEFSGEVRPGQAVLQAFLPPRVLRRLARR